MEGTCINQNQMRYVASVEIFSRIPGNPIAYWVSNAIVELFQNELLGKVAKPRIGQNTGDNNRFLRQWYEVNIYDITFGLTHHGISSCKYKWLPYNKGGEYRRWYGNQDYIVNWEDDGREIKEYAVIRNHGKHWSRYIQNTENMCRAGVTWSFISSGSFAVRHLPEGFICDVAGSAIFPDDEMNWYLTAFLNSKIADHILHILNPTINFQAGNVSSLPIKNEMFSEKDIKEITLENILTSKKDWDSFETSWDFKKHPLI